MGNNEADRPRIFGNFLGFLLIACIGCLFIVSERPDIIYLTKNKVLSREFTKAFAGKEFRSIHVNCTYYYPIVEYRSKEHFIVTDKEDADFVRKKKLCLLSSYGFDGSSYKIIRVGSGYSVLTTGQELRQEYSDRLLKTLLRAANFADESIEDSRIQKEQEGIQSQKVADSWQNVE